MIPTLRLGAAADRARVESLLQKLRLDPRQLAFGAAEDSTTVQKLLQDVAERGDEAIVEIARRFDDPAFTVNELRVRSEEMRDAAARVPAQQLGAIRHSIAQVREYQRHVMPARPGSLQRPGVELGLCFTPLDSAGLYFPGGKASYPSSLIMLAVPAQVAGVK